MTGSMNALGLFDRATAWSGAMGHGVVRAWWRYNWRTCEIVTTGFAFGIGSMEAVVDEG